MVAQGSDLYMLDTCVCIDLLRGRHGAEAFPERTLCRISSVVTAELRTGLLKGVQDADRIHAFHQLIALIKVSDFDDVAAEAYAEIRVDLERRGVPIGPMDLLIAAHAKSLGATLITANTGEFRRVKGLALLLWRSRKS